MAMKTTVLAKLLSQDYTKGEYLDSRVTVDFVRRSGEYEEKKDGKTTGKLIPWSHKKIRVTQIPLQGNGDPKTVVKQNKQGEHYAVTQSSSIFFTPEQFTDVQNIDLSSFDFDAETFGDDEEQE
jgi:hypothetical protein